MIRGKEQQEQRAEKAGARCAKATPFWKKGFGGLAPDRPRNDPKKRIWVRGAQAPRNASCSDSSPLDGYGCGGVWRGREGEEKVERGEKEEEDRR
jgi:hypothetical protein